MDITTDQVKALREKTGVSIMQCKKALEEAKGDVAKALVLLQKRGADIRAAKGNRSLGASLISSYIHGTGGVGAMVELSSETDFVAKNPEFKTLAYDIAMHIAASKPEYISNEEVTDEKKNVVRETFLKDVEGKPEAMKEKILEGKLASYFGERTLLSQPFIKNPEVTISNLIDNAIQKFGEKIVVARFVRYQSLEK